MAGKTNSDIIRELLTNVAIHEEGIANLKSAQEKIEQTANEAVKLDSELAVLQHRVGELERLQRNRTGYFWMLLGVIFGGILSFIGNLLLKVFS